MTQHNHRVFVEGCFRCDLHKDEIARLPEPEDVDSLARHMHDYEHARDCDCDAKGIGGPWGDTAEEILYWASSRDGAAVFRRYVEQAPR